MIRNNVVDVTVTDPCNNTNTRKVGPIPISTQRNSSHHFDSHAAQYNIIYSTMEKRKNKHYQELVNSNQSICETIFFTAGAFTTGGLCGEFRELIQEISVIAQKETSGWDPAEIVDGVRGSIAAAIQEGNAMVLNESWNRMGFGIFNRLLRPEREKEKRNGTYACARRLVNEMQRSTTPITLAA